MALLSNKYRTSIPLREYLDYVTQPCDIRHMTIWSLFKNGSGPLMTKSQPNFFPGIPFLILSWGVLTHYEKVIKLSYASDNTCLSHLVQTSPQSTLVYYSSRVHNFLIDMEKLPVGVRKKREKKKLFLFNEYFLPNNVFKMHAFSGIMLCILL